LLNSCAIEEEETETGDVCPHFYCPTTFELVTWDKYGKIELDDFGWDECARKLISKCGWHVYGGHNGGSGDTLQVATQNEGVILIWAWNNLEWIILKAGWTGTTAEGIGIGATLEEFLAVYPEFVLLSNSGPIYELQDSSNRKDSYVEATFANGVLVELRID
jgi:hypothetical protein